MHSKSCNVIELNETVTFRLFMVLIIIHIFGVATLLPWNMFITATDVSLNQTFLLIFSCQILIILCTCYSQYFKYKLAGDENKQYRGYFLSSLGFASQIPSLIMNIMNTFVHCGGGGKYVKAPAACVDCSFVTSCFCAEASAGCLLAFRGVWSSCCRSSSSPSFSRWSTRPTVSQQVFMLAAKSSVLFVLISSQIRAIVFLSLSDIKS